MTEKDGRKLNDRSRTTTEIIEKMEKTEIKKITEITSRETETYGRKLGDRAKITTKRKERTEKKEKTEKTKRT